ncbi:MAG: T9SS type A sorting domain-containing protein [bacterium]|nr:T9SS type A sorting domain-containing protein [bacterium]
MGRRGDRRAVPWDAGTDSGASYSSGGLPTVPPVPLFAIMDTPFTPGEPLGTFTFRLQSVAAVPPAPTLTARAYPNPFNPRVTIDWQAPQGTDVTVTVFDANGRRVREVFQENNAAERGRANWDGRDDAGRARRPPDRTCMWCRPASSAPVAA